MPLRDWFASRRHQQKQLDATALNSRLSDDDLCKLWTQCFQCRENIPTKELSQNLQVCPQCGYHFRISAQQRLLQLCDLGFEADTIPESLFAELNANMLPADPLNFTDTEPYIARQADARKKSKLNEAIVTGIWHAEPDLPVALGLMDFGYMGGSMGSVVGEKITRLVELALEKRLAVILFSSSGGARMQEGMFSLMQMVKTGSALAKLHEAGLLYISVLTEPTFGGVTASTGMLGDLNIAEEGARIGFAGRRVIEQTIRQKLPPDFQTANYLLNCGQVDQVVHRRQLRQTLIQLVRLHQRTSLGTSSEEASSKMSAGV